MAEAADRREPGGPYVAGAAQPDVQMFSPVTLGRISAAIVARIRGGIREGHLRPGDRLPSERELCERFDVSRVTVREALRVLESSGMIEIRVGAHGGAFVTTPTAEHVHAGVADYLSMSGVTPEAVTEARMVLELGIVPLVCDRATEADLAALEAICRDAEAALDRGTHDTTLSAAFHTQVARCTHNGAIELLLQSLQGPLRDSLAKARNAAPEMGHSGVVEHRALITAIRQRDAKRARAIMRPHLERTAARVRAAAR